jgi:hypothetical protein
MFPRARHLHPSLWPLALAATLALAPGCSRDPVPAGELVPYLNSRGLISYEYVLKKPPAVKPPTTASLPPLEVWLRQELAAARERRRLNALAEQDTRRERAELFRQEQRNIAAYQAARQQIVQSQRSEEQARNRDYQKQQSRWVESERLRAQADAALWAQASKPLDIPPAQDQW